MPDPIYIITEDPEFFSIGYHDDGEPARRTAMESLWKRFNRLDPTTGQTFKVWYRPTSRNPDVYVAYWMPPDSPSGRYRVETFVPGKHATTGRAFFTVANNFRQDAGQGETRHDDTFTIVDMFHLFDVWVSLGEYDLDPGKDLESGRVHQVSQSSEDPPAEVSFGPVRWVPVVAQPAGAGIFDPPLGTPAERALPFATGALAFGKFPIWVGNWFDLNPFLSWYSLGYHTGADLNLPGTPQADKDAPIYAVADGVVSHVGFHGGWGNIVVIEHPEALIRLPDGRQERRSVYSRYGHTQKNILVTKGQTVSRGQHIAFVGAPENALTAWHLHFDVGYSDKFKLIPQHWPDMRRIRQLQKAGASDKSREFLEAQAAVKAEVVAHYLDPLRFLKDNHG